MYNSSRGPAPLDGSRFLGIDGQGSLACARFAIAFCKWSRKVLSGGLDADPKPLCLSAMARLFSSAKIPKPGRDGFYQEPSSTNIAIVSGGRVWSIEVFKDGRLLAPEVLAREIEKARRAPAVPSEESLPVMTAARRDVWAAEREEVARDHANKQNLELIDRAILVLSLDKAEQELPSAKAKNFLLGDASSRWWDKHQLILDATGSMAISFQPSYSDESHWCRVIEECMADATCAQEGAYSQLPHFSGFSSAEPRELRFTVPVSTRQAIRGALAAYERARLGLGVECLNFGSWGEAEAQRWGISPDTAVQLALQLAYFRLHGRVGPASESLQMRRFFGGRTETVRSCTAEAREMCQAWKSGPGSARLLLNAATRHAGLTKAAVAGGGIDRHLFALEKFAEAAGEDVPLFRDPLYLRSRAWVMSSSNGTGLHITGHGLVPSHPEGHGIGYTVGASRITVCCASSAAGAKGPHAFADVLAHVLNDMKTVLSKKVVADPFAASIKRLPSLLGSELMGVKK